jgi:ribose transport system permease protein
MERLSAARIRNIENLGVIVIMIAFIIFVIALSGSKFFEPTNVTNILRSVSVTGIIATALTPVMIAGNIDLSVGWLVGFAACLTGVHSDSAPTAFLLAVGLSALCGALNGALVGLIKLNPFITTLGTMYLFKGITMMYSNGRQLTTPNPSPALEYVGGGKLLGIPFPIWIFAMTAAVFFFMLKNTNFGTKIYAVGANALAARFSGISYAKTVMITYTLGGIAAGVAGVILYTKVMSTQPYSGVGQEFDALSAIVLGGTSVAGGKGGVPGTVLGIVFVGILANGFTLVGLGSNAQYIVQGLVLIVAMRADVMRMVVK